MDEKKVLEQLEELRQVNLQNSIALIRLCAVCNLLCKRIGITDEDAAKAINDASEELAKRSNLRPTGAGTSVSDSARRQSDVLSAASEGVNFGISPVFETGQTAAHQGNIAAGHDLAVNHACGVSVEKAQASHP